jgi:hypothetical protein
MTVRKCSTCKHYEPAPIWRKGWCRNPALYSPQQSHLVGEDDLDCDRGMGNHWEPIESDTVAVRRQHTSQQPNADSLDPGYSDLPEGEESVPIRLTGFNAEQTVPERRGGVVSQYGGPGRPTGSGGFGSGRGGRDDDDRHTAQFSEGGDRDPYDSERTPFGYQPEERYWTDYLRIAAPVVGVILMLGLVWFWVASMLNNNDEDVAVNDDDVSGPVIPSETPTPVDDTEDDADAPITIMTPEAEDEDVDDTNGEPTPTEIGPGTTVLVTGTGEAGLNIRTSATTEAEVVDSVAEGTELTVTGESQQADGFTWWPVEVDGVTGFVVADFVELSTGE